MTCGPSAVPGVLCGHHCQYQRPDESRSTSLFELDDSTRCDFVFRLSLALAAFHLSANSFWPGDERFGDITVNRCQFGFGGFVLAIH